MPIVALCPYCRAGGVRAPESAVGQSVTCPSCKSNFTVVPSDDPAAQAARAAAPSPPPPPLWSVERAPDKPARPAPPRPAVDETREHSSPVDVTEPSPVLPGERRAPAPAPTYTPSEPGEPLDTGLAFALGGATLFGVGMAVAQFVPFGRAIGLVLCGVGAVGGVLSLGAEGRARLVGAGAAAVNLVAVLLLAFAPEFLGLAPWFGGDADDVEPEPTGPVAVSLKTGVAMPVGEAVKAEQAAWRAHGIRVDVRSTVGPVELVGPDGAKKRSREPVLLVAVRVTNEGVAGRAELSGWLTGATDQVTLTDPAGRRLKPKAFDPGWVPADRPAVAGSGLGPGTAYTVGLAFEPPAARADSLRLELPGAAAGLAETITFRLPGPFGPPAKK